MIFQHYKSIKTQNSVIYFAFKGRIQNKISINNYSTANCCKSFKYFVFAINCIKNAVEYLIRHFYFPIADRVFQ